MEFQLVKPKMIAVAVGAVMVLGAGLGSFYTVEQGHAGVVTRFGEYKETTLPGLHFKLPFLDSVTELSTRTWTDHASLQSYSKDQQPATIDISATWYIDGADAEFVYSNFKTLDVLTSSIIQPQLSKAFKDVFGGYTAATSIQDRARLGVDVQVRFEELVKSQHVHVKSVQIGNIDFSKEYERTVEDRMKAEVLVQTKKQQQEQEKIQANITVIQAQAQADSQLAQATANAKAITLRGDAEARAIKARGDALKQNPDLVELTKAERWNGELPQTMLPNTAIPFIDAKK